MGPDLELGPTGDEFRATLDRLADGRMDPRALVTGYVSLESAHLAFETLRPARPEDIEHVKVLVRHDMRLDGIVSPQDPYVAGRGPDA